jgi:serine/threonine-protein kinase HipA
MQEPKLMGVLSAQQPKVKAFSFEYDKTGSKQNKFLLDQTSNYMMVHNTKPKENFGIFLDSMPDTWGRTLMKRREAQLARKGMKNQNTL